MDLELYNKFFAANPLYVVDTHDEILTFTQIPSYDDIATLCRNNPEFIADEARIGAIEIVENQVLIDLEEYRDILADNAATLDGQILAAYEDVVRTAHSYYKAEREKYAYEVIDHIGRDPQAHDIVMESFSALNDDVVLTLGEEYQGIFDDIFNVFLNTYQKIIDPDAEVALDVKNYGFDFEVNLETAFKLADENAPTIKMTFDDVEKDIPLTFEMMGVLADEMPILPDGVEEMLENYNPDVQTAFDPFCAIDALNDEKEALLSTLSTGQDQQSKDLQIEALDGAIEHLENFYEAEIYEKVNAFIDNADYAGEVDAAMHVLEQWISDLTRYKKSDHAKDPSMKVSIIEFADGNIEILKQLYSGFSEEINSREQALLKYKESGLRNFGSKDSKRAIGTYAANVLNLH
jgi:hypothetical protein